MTTDQTKKLHKLLSNTNFVLDLIELPEEKIDLVIQFFNEIKNEKETEKLLFEYYFKNIVKKDIFNEKFVKIFLNINKHLTYIKFSFIERIVLLALFSDCYKEVDEELYEVWYDENLINLGKEKHLKILNVLIDSDFDINVFNEIVNKENQTKPFDEYLCLINKNRKKLKKVQ